ncbi:MULTISPECIES: hypothetical protein [unclassified Streptomyces]|nr:MULTISPECIES: hypothetical protein [unclassified Streptomyces]
MSRVAQRRPAAVWRAEQGVGDAARLLAAGTPGFAQDGDHRT